MSVGVDDLIEELSLRKRAEYLARQDGSKIDLLGRSVLEPDPQGEGTNAMAGPVRIAWRRR